MIEDGLSAAAHILQGEPDILFRNMDFPRKAAVRTQWTKQR